LTCKFLYEIIYLESQGNQQNKGEKMTEVKKFKVYHSKDWSLNSLLHFNTKNYVADKDYYVLVAVVHCCKLGDTFMFTNHIDKPWFEHMNVKVVQESRSTSVGDVVEDEDGQLWVCAGCGWEKTEWLDDDDFDSLKKDWRFWKPMFEKFNDTNAKDRMDKTWKKVEKVLDN
jgi:hypothetical protein